jgi:hypothetical protein
LAELPIRSLTTQFDPHHFLSPPPLFIDLRALQFQPRAIAVKCFLQCGYDNVGQTRLELLRKCWRRLAHVAGP